MAQTRTLCANNSTLGVVISNMVFDTKTNNLVFDTNKPVFDAENQVLGTNKKEAIPKFIF